MITAIIMHYRVLEEYRHLKNYLPALPPRSELSTPLPQLPRLRSTWVQSRTSPGMARPCWSGTMKSRSC